MDPKAACSASAKWSFTEFSCLHRSPPHTVLGAPLHRANVSESATSHPSPSLHPPATQCTNARAKGHCLFADTLQHPRETCAATYIWTILLPSSES